ncbi:ATP-dependent 6-phosphofructokinase [Iamia sp.]|uniref:6-phosphofructokinase n=1 Tax=Iamia sp. TaxID=2722710 RepID=UPI002CE11856|nr:ATP-dependent 6-phosphofructokinase [Iamia sp.]HXH59185.1 ATP-dependent 6-phosphofructokinase [Iamia sp.]
MRLGVLTSGGDCPGLNAVIRAVVRKVERHLNGTVIGFRDGYLGVMEDRYEVLTIDRCRGILPRGGTILGTSRHQPYAHPGGVDKVRATMVRRGLDGLVVIGGNGSLGAARDLHTDGVAVVGVPKTIDNDLGATEVTFGFDTAVATATEAIDRLHTTAESHDRVMLVEVMGRHVGHIATWSGIAGGASMILVPEEPFDIDEVCDTLRRRHDQGRFASIVVVAEGAVPVEGSFALPDPGVDQFGHQRLGGIAHLLAPEIEARTGFETKVVVLGYLQRGGSPTAADRVLASRFGIAAAEAAADHEWGTMVAIRAGKVVRVPLVEAVAEPKVVAADIHDVGKVFFA